MEAEGPVTWHARLGHLTWVPESALRRARAFGSRRHLGRALREGRAHFTQASVPWRRASATLPPAMPPGPLGAADRRSLFRLLLPR